LRQQGAPGQHDPPQQPTSQQGGVLAQQPCEYAQDRKVKKNINITI